MKRIELVLLVTAIGFFNECASRRDGFNRQPEAVKIGEWSFLVSEYVERRRNVFPRFLFSRMFSLYVYHPIRCLSATGGLFDRMNDVETVFKYAVKNVNSLRDSNSPRIKMGESCQVFRRFP